MNLDSLLEAIRSESLDGWLFYNFKHRDPLSDSILERDPATSNSRRWFYALSSSGDAVKIVHEIEKNVLGDLPGTMSTYSSLDELRVRIKSLGPGRWACHYSPNLPVLSFLDAGTLELLKYGGLECVGAESLIQRAFSLLSPQGLASHERSAKRLYKIVDRVWRGIDEGYAVGRDIFEGQVRDWILEAFAASGLITDHPPIVASGSHAGDPHYEARGSGSAFKEGDAIQIDLWAKEAGPGAIYADISWVGVFSSRRNARFEAIAADLFNARDEAVALIQKAAAKGISARGMDVDAAVRDILIARGHGSALRHRTGHGIDVECHGSGVNLDSVEFPDKRLILPGSCFSIEPGLYFHDFGFRTEIDVFMEGMEPRVSGGPVQNSLLYCGRP